MMLLRLAEAGRSVDKPLRVRQLPAADRLELICSAIRFKMWYT
jgi:hypothetical protein